MPAPFVIVRDARGSLVHVRTPDGECVGCIEVGLYEIVRTLLAEERAATDLAVGVGEERDPSQRRLTECFEGDTTDD